MVGKLFLGLAASLAIVGCGNLDTGDNYDQSYQDHSYTFTEGNREFGDGTYLFCNDANCSAIDSSISLNLNGEGEPDAIVGEYNPDYTEAECQAAGFFWCTIDQKCLNQRVDDSSSSCDK